MKLPNSTYNWISLSGAVIALVSLFMIAFLFILSMLFNQGNSYLGLFMFIVLPIFLVGGLILIPIGMLIKMRRDKRLAVSPEKRWPEINFNLTRHRNAFVVFSIGTIIFVLVSAVGSYEAFHYTESVEFCGTVCHVVMEPEYVAYQNSSHARVACVDCHVGPGADWYMRSKLSGLYQVYAVVRGIYPQPIPTPISNLRPARETCERCHWPEKFYARQNRIEKHYLPDMENTEWDINLQIKTGPSYSALGLQEGIHWHINPDVKIEYIASPNREEIPWVKYTNLKTGEVYVYEDEETKKSPQILATMEKRVMDCMDCHNRPSHLYNSPMKFTNNMLTSGKLPKALPDIKFLAMQVLHVEFPTKDSAFRHIEQEVRAYYNMMYPNRTDLTGMVEQSILALQSEFAKNIFPYMKVNWEKYPNHIGHLESDGCFRCHNNKHKSKEGRVISMDCNLCHHILAQGPPDNMQIGNVYGSLDFWHPNDDQGSWKEYKCTDCHKDLYK